MTIFIIAWSLFKIKKMNKEIAMKVLSKKISLGLLILLVSVSSIYSNTNNSTQKEGSCEALKGLLDPSTDEFWRENGHLPPADQLRLLKNPSKRNAKILLKRTKIKEQRLKEASALLDQVRKDHENKVKNNTNL